MNRGQRRLVLTSLVACAWVCHMGFCEWSASRIQQAHATCSFIHNARDDAEARSRFIEASQRGWEREKARRFEKLGISYKEEQLDLDEVNAPINVHNALFSGDMERWCGLAAVHQPLFAYLFTDDAGFPLPAQWRVSASIAFGIILPFVLLGITLFLHIGWREPSEVKLTSDTLSEFVR